MLGRSARQTSIACREERILTVESVDNIRMLFDVADVILDQQPGPRFILWCQNAIALSVNVSETSKLKSPLTSSTAWLPPLSF